MTHSIQKRRVSLLAPSVLLAAFALAGSGCTPLRDYLGNGLKVGPDYHGVAAPVASDWIDAGDKQVSSQPADLARWWCVFQDPVLDGLMQTALRQNLSLREAGCRVLAARAARAVVAGNLFPQQQDMVGGYGRNAASTARANMEYLPRKFYDEWNAGFNLSWELDFWGRFRRAIEAADADLDASVADYDQVMVTLLGDIGATYVEIRTAQQQIELVRANIKLQRETLTIATARYRGGQVSELDVDQATSTLAQNEALLPRLELLRREAQNRLCVLLGVPPTDLAPVLGAGPIPTTPPEVVLGIPADLLRRRPDIRRAEREVAAQSARVGIATAELYPHIGITGTLDYSARLYGDLFTPAAFAGTVGPSFRWSILNYGRLLNAIREQDAVLAERIVAYQNLVLRANAEAENGVAQFLRNRQRAAWLATSVEASRKAVDIALAQYRGGIIDFNWVAIVEQNLVNQQDLLAQSQGDTALGLVATYRALGGGWQSGPRPMGEIARPGLPGPVPIVIPAWAPEIGPKVDAGAAGGQMAPMVLETLPAGTVLPSQGAPQPTILRQPTAPRQPASGPEVERLPAPMPEASRGEAAPPSLSKTVWSPPARWLW